MAEDRVCNQENCRDQFGNCLTLAHDDLPIQCVGGWVEDKYYFLESYLNVSCEARKKFSDKGNAVFIDLFSGPGKCVLKEQGREIDCGGVRATLRDRGPFNEFHFFDNHKKNIDALRQRIRSELKCNYVCGDSNEEVFGLVRNLLRTPYRYHFAFIDPFGPEGLKFTTLAELAKLSRMDMLIHFPIGAIKRNIPSWLNTGGQILDEYLGTDVWRERIRHNKADAYKILIEEFTEQLERIGYPKEGLRTAESTELPAVSVKNRRNVDLYVLILASKHELGQKIWNSVIKYMPDGQKMLF